MNLIKHDHYREICAAASIGQATPQELFELEKHVAECEPCSQAYFDFLNLAARQYAGANQNPALSSSGAKESLNSELFTRRFFERAEREGIQFSPEVGRDVRRLAPMPLPLPHSRLAGWQFPEQAVAVLVLFGLTLSAGYFYGRRSSGRDSANWARFTTRPSPSPPSSESSNLSARLNHQVAELTATNLRLEAGILGLKAALKEAGEQLRSAQTDLNATAQDREKLAATQAALEAQLKSVQDALTQSQALVATAQRDAAQQRDHASGLKAVLVDDRVKMSDLADELAEKSATLDKERQLLALGHDVSDLMGARNLHVVDVVDTDPRGKSRPAFGRIFFTEGKSLVFYAYDLNEAKIQKANYQYRIWAKQEGGDKQIRSLGIFYSDDKSQRRWVFKCNDPQILGEIDSVFVTLEPADSDPAHPKGQNMMYAYLRGQPNHP
jgi:hypothetical protein